MSSDDPADNAGVPVYSTASVSDSQPSASELARAAGALAELPEKIAEYQIHGTIGRGGMGTVYEGEQVRLHRRVAIKLISPGLLRESAQRRFEYESTLLARLDHPGIARIYHAGIWEGTAGPQPFFAMELLDGIKLDEYLKENRPRLKQRQLIELFHEICSAVQHAHSRGIVHRDLKPDNILITKEGKPKILDFGVARAIDADTQATVHTESGAIVGTIPYMAPEQIRGEVDDLDQGTDVYALGVIGYEILSDRMPYPVKGRPLPEAARIICEEEPSRLSSINKSLRGDVETIVQKALEKEKTRRYHTAGELASDVKRYLDYEPITARPPNSWYNLRKFARRNKVLVGGIMATMVVLLGGVIISSWLYFRAENQRQEAKRQGDLAVQTKEFLIQTLQSQDPVEGGKQDISVTQAMQQALERLNQGELSEQPALQASLLDAIAMILNNNGQSDRALPLAERALEMRQWLFKGDHPDVALSLNNFASVRGELGRAAEAEPLYQQALEMRRRLFKGDHPDVAQGLNNFASVRLDLGRAAEAEPRFEKALEMRRRLFKGDHPLVATSLNNLAGVRDALGRAAEAEPLYHQALEMSQRLFKGDHPDVALSLKNLAEVRHTLGRAAEAQPLSQQALEMRQRLFKGDHPDVARSLNNLAAARLDSGRAAEAEPLFRQALEMRRRLFNGDHPDVALSLNNLASARRDLGRAAEAEPLYRESLRMSRATLGDTHPQTKQIADNLAKLLDQTGRQDEAAALRKQLGLSEPATHSATLPTTAPTTTPAEL